MHRDRFGSLRATSVSSVCATLASEAALQRVNTGVHPDRRISLCQVIIAFLPGSQFGAHGVQHVRCCQRCGALDLAASF